MRDWIEFIYNLMYNPLFIVAILVIGGLIVCLAGYRIFRVYSAIIGFVIGVILGYYISLFIGYSFLTYILTGIIMAVIFGLFYNTGLFITGVVIGYMFLNYLLPERALYSYVFAVLCGILVLFMERALIMVITAFLGATAIVVAVKMLITGESVEAILFDPRSALQVAFSSPLLFLLWFVMGVIGIVTQILLTKETTTD
ncbi:MAG: TMEM198/TM7SF3 family protein [Archaeoglobaceae archaeon]|nr:TMEM198/TM7SF3 family protein [Archaeoglobaceae archaeon]